MEFNRNYHFEMCLDGSKVARLPVELFYMFAPFLNLGFFPYPQAGVLVA